MYNTTNFLGTSLLFGIDRVSVHQAKFTKISYIRTYIDWVVFNANLSSISDISWHEKDYCYLLIDPPPPSRHKETHTHKHIKVQFAILLNLLQRYNNFNINILFI